MVRQLHRVQGPMPNSSVEIGEPRKKGCRHAAGAHRSERGFNVQVVVDASVCFTRQIEEASLLPLQQAGITLTTSVMLASKFHRASDLQEGVGPRAYEDLPGAPRGYRAHRNADCHSIAAPCPRRRR